VRVTVAAFTAEIFLSNCAAEQGKPTFFDLPIQRKKTSDAPAREGAIGYLSPADGR
jgi:hypothetical protein